MKPIMLFFMCVLFTIAMNAKEVSFTIHLDDNGIQHTVGDFTIKQTLMTSRGPKTPTGFAHFGYLEFRIHQKGDKASKSKKILFQKNDLDAGVIKTIEYDTIRFQIRLDTIIGKTEVPNPKNKSNPDYLLKGVNYTVIISDK